MRTIKDNTDVKNTIVQTSFHLFYPEEEVKRLLWDLPKKKR